jgi:hypothetical protein
VCYNRPKAGVGGVQFWLRPVWSPKRPIYASLRCQLIARATYLPEGLSPAAPPVSVGRYSDLSPASPPVRQASVSVGRVKRPFFAALRLEDSAGSFQPEDKGGYPACSMTAHGKARACPRLSCSKAVATRCISAAVAPTSRATVRHEEVAVATCLMMARASSRESAK